MTDDPRFVEWSRADAAVNSPARATRSVAANDDDWGDVPDNTRHYFTRLAIAAVDAAATLPQPVPPRAPTAHIRYSVNGVVIELVVDGEKT